MGIVSAVVCCLLFEMLDRLRSTRAAHAEPLFQVATYANTASAVPVYIVSTSADAPYVARTNTMSSFESVCGFVGLGSSSCSLLPIRALWQEVTLSGARMGPNCTPTASTRTVYSALSPSLFNFTVQQNPKTAPETSLDSGTSYTSFATSA